VDISTISYLYIINDGNVNTLYLILIQSSLLGNMLGKMHYVSHAPLEKSRVTITAAVKGVVLILDER